MQERHCIDFKSRRSIHLFLYDLENPGIIHCNTQLGERKNVCDQTQKPIRTACLHRKNRAE